MFRPPPLESCCYCVSLHNGINVFALLSLIDCVSVYVSSIYGYLHTIKDCKAERMACTVVFGDVALRTVYALFVVGLLMSVYKVAHPRLILWWAFATLFVSVLTTFVLVPFVGSFNHVLQPLFIALSVWEMYGSYVGYSYYMHLTEGNIETSNET